MLAATVALGHLFTVNDSSMGCAVKKRPKSDREVECLGGTSLSSSAPSSCASAPPRRASACLGRLKTMLLNAFKIFQVA